MTDVDMKKDFCKDCGGLKDLKIDGESVSVDHWVDYGYSHDHGCFCDNPDEAGGGLSQKETVLLGNGDILYIDGEKDGFYTCSKVSEKTGGVISGVLVPKRPCVKSDKDGITYECVPSQVRAEQDSKDYKELASLNFNVDYSNVDVWVKLKKRGLVKVVKTTEKSVHFLDADGKKRYTSVTNVKGIYNYSPEKKIPTAEEQKTRKQKIKKSAKNPKSSKSIPKKKVAASTSKKSGKVEYLTEVPREAEYRDRDVYIDIDENRKGMKVKNSRGGRVFWEDPNTGKYSAISLKKVNENESIVVYEYK